MRRFAVFLALASVACGTSIHEQMAFKDATTAPRLVRGEVGDLVKFDVRPPVSRGSVWELWCGPPVRFEGNDVDTSIDWVAEHPIRMETVVSAWELPAERQNWLSYVRKEGGADVEPVGLALPVRALPYREIAPVTGTAVYSIAPRDQPITFKVQRGRAIVTYKTPIAGGTAWAPEIRAALVQTSRRRLLYAEVRTNFGAQAAEKMGYEVNLSYDEKLTGPIDVMIVEWVGYGEYFHPFHVTTAVVDSAVAKAAAAEATKPASATTPAPSAAPAPSPATLTPPPTAAPAPVPAR